jgi:hypothetical protein
LRYSQGTQLGRQTERGCRDVSVTEGIISPLRRDFWDRRLQLILLVVIAAGFPFVFVLGADTHVAAGVVVIGFVTVLIESRYHRRKK